MTPEIALTNISDFKDRSSNIKEVLLAGCDRQLLQAREELGPLLAQRKGSVFHDKMDDLDLLKDAFKLCANIQYKFLDTLDDVFQNIDNKSDDQEKNTDIFLKSLEDQFKFITEDVFIVGMEFIEAVQSYVNMVFDFNSGARDHDEIEAVERSQEVLSTDNFFELIPAVQQFAQLNEDILKVIEGIKAAIPKNTMLAVKDSFKNLSKSTMLMMALPTAIMTTRGKEESEDKLREHRHGDAGVFGSADLDIDLQPKFYRGQHETEREDLEEKLEDAVFLDRNVQMILKTAGLESLTMSDLREAGLDFGEKMTTLAKKMGLK